MDDDVKLKAFACYFEKDFLAVFLELKLGASHFPIKISGNNFMPTDRFSYGSNDWHLGWGCR